MNILLVEDDLRISEFIQRGLVFEGHAVSHAKDGETALKIFETEAHAYDVIVLDLMLPGISGLEVTTALRLRKNVTPILILSALGTAEERVTGLKRGADDYLPKPFDFDELVARLQALCRRSSQLLTHHNADKPLDAHVVFDKRSMMLQVDGQSITLSGKERELLIVLMSNIGSVVTRTRILFSVWGLTEDPMTNTIDVYIARLRKKLGSYGGRITTVRDVGYRYD